MAPASKVLGKQEDEVPPDKVNGKKKTTPKSNPYEANPKFPRIFPCKLCPRKFSFVLNLCTHVEIHHRSQFSKIKYGPNKEAAIIHLVQEWVWDIKKEPVILEKEVDEDPDVPEKPHDGGAVVNIVQMIPIVQVVDVGKHEKPRKCKKRKNKKSESQFGEDYSLPRGWTILNNFELFQPSCFQFFILIS